MTISQNPILPAQMSITKIPTAPTFLYEFPETFRIIVNMDPLTMLLYLRNLY